MELSDLFLAGLLLLLYLDSGDEELLIIMLAFLFIK